MKRTTATASVFDTVSALEAEEEQDNANRRRRRRRHLTSNSSSADLRLRSQAAHSQISLYQSLVECRILLQRAIHSDKEQPGSVPPTSSLQQEVAISEEDDTQPENSHNIDCYNELIVQLLEARSKLSQPNGRSSVDYESIVNAANDGTEEDEDRLEDLLQSEFEGHCDEWKEVLNRRHKDVRLHSGALTNKTQFRVMDSTFWQQVESQVQNETLRQRQQTMDDPSDHPAAGQSQHPEQFDDTKLYQLMLKDFLTTSTTTSADSANPAKAAALAAQQRLANRQKSSGSTKAAVDRKASKGRKIRYTEIPKLTNFTFPLSRPATATSAFTTSVATLDEEAWFLSLFGGSGKVQS